MSYGVLSSKSVVETITRLRSRIGERFPNSGLFGLSEKILNVAKESQTRAEWISKPHIGLRCLIAIFILFVLGITTLGLMGLHLDVRTSSLSDFVQMLEAATNDVILLGGGLYLLFTVEKRIKRKKTMRILHSLRSLAHIVDMHQLTKDPSKMFDKASKTISSPDVITDPFLLNRYLDYCSELLSLISKISALYAQHFDDQVVLNAVDEIEDLTNGLSQKIWQKILVIQKVG